MTEYLPTFLLLLIPVGAILGTVAGIFSMIATGARNSDDTVTPNKKALVISLLVTLILAIGVACYLAWKKNLAMNERTSSITFYDGDRRTT